MPSFDLLTEPFFGAVRLNDGKMEQIGLLGALTRAHEFREIRDPMPTAEFSLYRLCIALLLDIFFLETQEELTEADIRWRLEQGRLDEEGLRAISIYATRYASHFDLFSETQPFLQTAGLTGEEKPVAGLLHPQPTGINANHFAHGHESDFGVSPAAAARLLVTIAPFMTAGGAGLSPSINGAPPVYALVRGDNLYETLWLNLYGGTLPSAGGTARPAWHSSGAVGGARKTGASYAESLTWMPRRLRLTPGEGGRCTLTGEDSPVLVRTMKFVAGDACDFSWLDPNCAYRVGDKGPVVLRMRKGRALWRDTGPLALLTASEGFLRPAVVTQASENVPERPLRLILYGLRTDLKMKMFEWQREALTVPGELVQGSAFVADAVEGMEQADKASYYLRQAIKGAYPLRQAIKGAYPRGGAGNKNAFGGLSEGAERGYWATLQTVYKNFLEELGGLDANDASGRAKARSKWAKAVKEVAQASLHAAVDGLDTDAAALERQTRAFKSLDADLYVLFLSPEEREARRQNKKNKAAKAAAVTEQGDFFT